MAVECQIVTTGSPKDYPGAWTGYAVHEGGVRQVVRRVAAPDCMARTERTGRALAGGWALTSPGMRSHRCFRALKRAFARGCERFGFRLIHFSVQGNHIHLIVEAPDEVQLGRAMKGLGVRIARVMNRAMARKGQVIAHRYYARILRTPPEVNFAILYVLHNRAHHIAREGWPLPPRYEDPLTSEGTRGHDPPLVASPRLWLLRVSWPGQA